MSGPSIAVVILNWNGKALLRNFLPAVLTNSDMDNVRVVVVDNASTDDSVVFLRTNFPHLQLVVLDQNYGFAGGYNKALDLLGDEYFILLNSDAVPEKGWLVPLIDAIGHNRSLALAMPKIRSCKNPEMFEYAGAAGGFIDRFGYPFCRGRILDVVEVDHGQYDNPSEVFWASGAAFLVKAELYKQVGGLDEDFFAHMEEIDLCWRLKNRGHQVLYVPQSVVYHVGGASLHQSHPRKTYLNFRNNLFMLVKNLPRYKTLGVLFVRMVLDGVAAGKFLLSGEFGFAWAVFKAHVSFYAKLPLFLRKRRALFPHVIQTQHPEIYKGSIAFDYYVRKKRRFDQLGFRVSQ